MYEVTLTQNLTANHQTYHAGEQLTVDAALYAELEAHGIITNVREIEVVAKVDETADVETVEPKKSSTRKAKATPVEDGE